MPEIPKHDEEDFHDDEELLDEELLDPDKQDAFNEEFDDFLSEQEGEIDENIQPQLEEAKQAIRKEKGFPADAEVIVPEERKIEMRKKERENFHKREKSKISMEVSRRTGNEIWKDLPRVEVAEREKKEQRLQEILDEWKYENYEVGIESFYFEYLENYKDAEVVEDMRRRFNEKLPEDQRLSREEFQIMCKIIMKNKQAFLDEILFLKRLRALDDIAVKHPDSQKYAKQARKVYLREPPYDKLSPEEREQLIDKIYRQAIEAERKAGREENAKALEDVLEVEEQVKEQVRLVQEFIDVQEQKEREEALREEEARAAAKMADLENDMFLNGLSAEGKEAYRALESESRDFAKKLRAIGTINSHGDGFVATVEGEEIYVEQCVTGELDVYLMERGKKIPLPELNAKGFDIARTLKLAVAMDIAVLEEECNLQEKFLSSLAQINPFDAQFMNTVEAERLRGFFALIFPEGATKGDEARILRELRLTDDAGAPNELYLQWFGRQLASLSTGGVGDLTHKDLLRISERWNDKGFKVLTTQEILELRKEGQAEK